MSVFVNLVGIPYCEVLIENNIHVDVQVSLLNQEVIIEKIQSVVESKLRNSNEARTFQEQVFLANLVTKLQTRSILVFYKKISTFLNHVYIVDLPPMPTSNRIKKELQRDYSF